MRRIDPARVVPQLVAPVAALLLAAGVCSVALAISGKDSLAAYRQMLAYGILPDSQAEILNKATYYYIAAIAVAIGFRMGLFNIGVDGQSRLGAFFAAVLATAPFLDGLPGVARILLLVITSMVIAAAWAAIAGLLKVYRGVSEVISTIMLNVIGAGIVAWLNADHWGVQAKGSNAVTTRILPADSWVPALPLVPGANDGVFGFIVVAALLGVVYWFVLGRTRFGFDLRATGYNPSAAVASGVDAKRMVLIAMALSGAVAGLVSLPLVLGEYHAYTQDVGGIGFTGIAIALLGRNHPVGIAFAALLWGFLERSALILDLEAVPHEIVTIMQAVTVLAVVIAYELASRLGKRAQQRRVGAVAALPVGPEPAKASQP
jgi:simple sugar transport system permease protein